MDAARAYRSPERCRSVTRCRSRQTRPATRRLKVRNRRQLLAFSVGTDYYDTGKMGDHWGTGIPVQVTRQLMERGQQRFNITCAMCHGATAAGNGITKQYGLATVVSLQDERIRKMADGEIFNTITNGKNTMMAYGPNIMVADRWAIIAYLRALQRSQNGAIADVPPEHRAESGQAGGSQKRSETGGVKEMSDRSQTPPTPEGEYFESESFRRTFGVAWRSLRWWLWRFAERVPQSIRTNLVFPGYLPLHFISPSAPAVSSGQ